MTSMEGELDVLRDISKKLTDAKIPFMITGSMAMNHYAEPRMTRDIDIVIALGTKEVGSLAQILKLNYLFSIETAFEAVARRSIFNVIHESSLIKIDFIVQKDSAFRQCEFERKQKIRIQDFETFIVSKEDLILSKLEWSKDSKSELQQRDVRNLIATSCDETYLNDWAEKLGLEEALRVCINE